MRKILIVLLLFGSLSSIKADELIRLRVIANSNSKYDQKIKTKVKKEIEQLLIKNIDTSNIASARKSIKKEMSNLNESINNLFLKENYNKSFTINYGNNYFPKKKYMGNTYKAGYYESLVVTIGEGKGKNWWCILFPPFCLVEAKKSNKKEYKFFVKELLDKYFQS